MKHIKLLGILTILIIITEFVLSIPSGMESFQEGMEAGMQEATACKNNAQTPLPHPIKVTGQSRKRTAADSNTELRTEPDHAGCICNGQYYL